MTCGEMTRSDLTELFPLSDAPKHLPKRGGKRYSQCSIWRWHAKGRRRRGDGALIRLETWQVGGILMTSRAALERFVERLSERPGEDAAPPSERERLAAAERAGDALERMSC